MSATSSGSGVVMMVTGIPQEQRQNELYLKSKELNGNLIRDKTTAKYQPRTTHVIVGALAKTEKLLCGLAAGIPLVDPSFIYDSCKRGTWTEELGSIDVGNPSHPLRLANDKLFIHPLTERQRLKKEGGIFKDWTAVVVMDDVNLQDVYRRLLELGGAKVKKWTSKHLSDLKPAQLKTITHIFSRPQMMLNEDFQTFLANNDKQSKVIPVLAYIYIGDFLTKQLPPAADLYDIRRSAMITLLVPHDANDEDDNCREYILNHFCREVQIPVNEPNLQFPMLPRRGRSQNASCSRLEQSLIISDDFPSMADVDEDDLVPVRQLHANTHPLKRAASRELLQESSKKSKPSRKSDIEEVILGDDDPNDALEEGKRQIDVAALKQFSKKFMKNEASTSSSPSQQLSLDSWVSKSPRVSSKKTLVTVEEDDIVCLDMPTDSGSKDVQRRFTPARTETPFLVKTRSGSTKASTARSLNYFSQESSDSQGEKPGEFSSQSQDSFISEAGSLDLSQLDPNTFDINNIAQDPVKQKVYLINQMNVQRRLVTHRLGVGDRGVPLKFPESEEEPNQLFAAMCRNIWNCLDSEEELEDLGRNIDIGWIEACELLMKTVDVDTFAPAAAMHKIMMEAVKDPKKDILIKFSAYEALVHCVNHHPPGPDTEHRRRMKDLYLEMFSKSTPHVDKWEFNPMDPLNLLENLIEECISHSKNNNESLDSTGSLNRSNKQSSTGSSLVLKLFTLICDIDLNNWFDWNVKNNSIDSDYKPFIACVLCPNEGISWSKGYQGILKIYCKAIAVRLPEEDMGSVRKIVGFAAQVLQFKDLISKSRQNDLKLEMANFIARQMMSLNLDENILWGELFLLEPSWLSALVSRSMLSITTHTPLNDHVSLRSIVTKFVDTNLSMNTDECAEEETCIVTSTPMSRKLMNNNVSMPMSPVKSPMKSSVNTKPSAGKPSKSSKAKIKVNQKNKFGETPLHLAAKKGNVIKLQDCLNTPGVDINAVDNNGYTPLSEAASKNHIQAVEILLNFTPKSLPINSFFTPTKGGKNPVAKKLRVDILKQNNEDGKNPFHEAIEDDNIAITRLFLETLSKEESKPDSGLPTVATLLSSNTANGESPSSLATTEQMRDLLSKYGNNKGRKKVGGKENSLVALTTSVHINNQALFKVLLETFITKYLSINCLSHYYKIFISNHPDDLIKAMQSISSKKVDKVGRIEFCGGFKPQIFGKTPRFEVFRDKLVVAQDVRDFEKLLKHEETLKQISTDHPILPLLKAMKI